MSNPPVPPPAHWNHSIQQVLVRVMALARIALGAAYAGVARGSDRRATKLLVTRDHEIGLLHEELRIKDARWAKLPPAKRPHYSPTERLAILELRAARGWNAEQTAARFFVTPATIQSWMSQLDSGELLQTGSPVNKFPEFV